MSLAGMVSWGALAVLVYAYFGYPLLLWALARLRRCTRRASLDARG